MTDLRRLALDRLGGIQEAYGGDYLIWLDPAGNPGGWKAFPVRLLPLPLHPAPDNGLMAADTAGELEDLIRADQATRNGPR